VYPFRRRGSWKAVVGLVTGGHFLSHFYLLVFPPLFPALRSAFDLSNTELGLIVSAIAVTTFLQIPVGDLVDRIGARPVFLTGTALTGIGVGLVGMAPSYLAVLAFALVSGIGQSAFHPADYALLDAVSTGQAEGRSFGIHTFGGYAGYATAPIVVGTIAAWADWRMALLTVGGFGIGYAVLAWFLLEPVHQGHRGDRSVGDGENEDSSIQAMLTVGMVLVFGLFVLITMASVGIQTFTPVLFIDGYGFSETAGNSALTAFFVLAAIGVLVGGYLADRYAPAQVIAVVVVFAAVGTGLAVVSGLVPTSLVAIGILATIGLFNGLALPSRDRLVNALSPPGAVGKGFGVVFSAAALAQLIAPALLGAVIDYSTVASAFGLIAGLFLVTALVAVAVEMID